MSSINDRIAQQLELLAEPSRAVLPADPLAEELANLLIDIYAGGKVGSEAGPTKSRRRSRSTKPAIDPSALRNLESLPLFAPDNMLGAALFGPERVQEWCQIAPMLEARGLPKVDPLMGGRYKRAVVAFFDQQYGLHRDADAPLAPDGIEDFGSWKRRKRPV